jgi:hypothetical protein
MNPSQIGPPADAAAQPPPASSRLLVLRRAISPARPAQQGCSAAVAAVRPLGGPGGVFGKMKTGRADEVPARKPLDKDKSHADHEG